jgi:hypothetical protein
VNELENHTNSLLRQKTDVGGLIRGENAYSIVKCSFKDSILKPKTVSNIKMSVNILDSELISPIFHYQVTVEYLIKELLSKNITDMLDKEIEKLKDSLIDEGKDELSDSEIIFEKMKRVENFTDDEKDSVKSRRYSIVAKNLMDAIEGLRAEIDPTTFDQLNVRENLKKIIDIENIRNRGYNTAVNSLTSILDTSKMGYQYIENLKNARELIVREYEDTDVQSLPDERYQIKMRYYDSTQLIEEQKAYDIQVKSFELEVQHLKDILEMVYQDSKKFKGITDYEDLAKAYKNKIARNIKAKTGDPLYENIDKVWDEISFVKANETSVEDMNRTYIFEKDKTKKFFVLMRKKLQAMFSYKYPIQRRVMEERLNRLESQFNDFDYLINPYHIQPGLLLDIDITSIKRKKATLDGMANVLNEFLYGVSKGFQDAAFASFARRRSTVRSDLSQSFATADESLEHSEENKGQSYLDLLNSSMSDERPAQQQLAVAKAADKPANKQSARSHGVVDNSKKKSSSTTRRQSGNKLTTI